MSLWCFHCQNSVEAIKFNILHSTSLLLGTNAYIGLLFVFCFVFFPPILKAYSTINTDKKDLWRNLSGLHHEPSIHVVVLPWSLKTSPRGGAVLWFRHPNQMPESPLLVLLAQRNCASIPSSFQISLRVWTHQTDQMSEPLGTSVSIWYPFFFLVFCTPSA